MNTERPTPSPPQVDSAEPDATLQAVRESFDAEVPPDLEHRLAASVEGFRKDLREHPYVRRLDARRSAPSSRGSVSRWRRWFGLHPRLNPFATPSTAMGLGAALVALVVVIGALLVGTSTPTWAQVAARFKSVQFLSVVVYAKLDALSDPEQIEIWLGKGGHARLRVGPQVVFGSSGKVTAAFDIKTGEKAKADEIAGGLLEKLGANGEFSLDTALHAFAGGKLQEATPLVNQDAAISEDLVVFDIQPEHNGSEWGRIWALKSSRLPMRIRVWAPNGGECVDAFFTYSQDQPAAFFDPVEFEKATYRPGTSESARAYALLKDPGGLPITPQDYEKHLEENPVHEPYHLPVLEQAGITPLGAVWVVASKATNQDAKGNPYSQFDLRDELGRKYESVEAANRTDGDIGSQVFVPFDYPFDPARPTSLTLVSYRDEFGREGVKRIVMGQIPVSTQPVGMEESGWKGEAEPPAKLFEEHDADYRLTLAALHLNYRKDTARAVRLLDTIPGDPEDDARALRRERLRLDALALAKDWEAAAPLAQRLIPLLVKQYGTFVPEYRRRGLTLLDFSDPLAALAATGKVEAAKALYAQIAHSPAPPLPEKYSDRTRKEVLKGLADDGDRLVPRLAEDLSEKAHFTVEQVGQIVGVDVTTDPRFKDLYTWDWQPTYNMPEYRTWRKHLEELAGYYKSHPLPERFEFLPRKNIGKFVQYRSDIPNIESHGVMAIHGELRRNLLSTNAPTGCLRIVPNVGSITLPDLDLVYCKNLTDWRELGSNLLARAGAQITTATESRTVWVAHYDGRPLKPWKEVHAPLPRKKPDEAWKPGMANEYTRIPLKGLFERLAMAQDPNCLAKGLLIVDETGIPDKAAPDGNPESYIVSGEGPWWSGTDADLPVARRWFEEQFGITFTEETRPVVVYTLSRIGTKP